MCFKDSSEMIDQGDDDLPLDKFGFWSLLFFRNKKKQLKSVSYQFTWFSHHLSAWHIIRGPDCCVIFFEISLSKVLEYDGTRAVDDFNCTFSSKLVEITALILKTNKLPRKKLLKPQILIGSRLYNPIWDLRKRNVSIRWWGGEACQSG